MKITIVGGGNIGTQFAVHCAEKGNDVVIFTSEPHLFNKHLSIVDENYECIHEGDILYATDRPEKAFVNADIIILTVPAMIIPKYEKYIYNYAGNEAVIGIIPGNGGGECVLRRCIKRGNTVFGLERVPAIARLIKRGSVVRCIGYRNELHVASLPGSSVNRCADIVESLFDIHCTCIPCYLSLSMTPSNPILHSARLRCIFKGYIPGVTYSELPLFYEDWDDESSRLLLLCDEEVQDICRSLPECSLEYVSSLKNHYQSFTIKDMTAKISSIPAFQGLETPSVKTDNGLIPDLHNRYFVADFSYGLSVIQQIGEYCGVKTPNIDDTMNWYRDISIEKEEFRFRDYKILSCDMMKEFYLL